MTTRRGRFITLEGIDGAGKSTQHQWLVSFLQERGLDAVATREPGGTPLGEKLRALLLSDAMDLETEALLMFAARREHVVAVIEPALAAGRWVVCDRFVDATFAYQGGGRGLDWGRLRGLADWVLGDFAPDLTFWFDVPVAVGQARVRQATETPDRFEREQAEFFSRVREGYLRRASEEPLRIRRIDALQAPEEISKQLEEISLKYCLN